MRHARSLVRRVCDIAGQVTWIDDLRYDAIETGLVAAVEDHDTAAIFDWLMWMLSFQGISDAVAEGYMDRHGNVTWADIEASLATNPGCDKLQGYWAFTGCQYHKGFQTCAEPDEFADCPLPRHPLRNGRLNQTAYSLFLFIRDIAGGDIVEWIDRQLADHAGSGNLAAARAALVDPLRHVYGISDKVIAMALASLLMGAGETGPVGSTLERVSLSSTPWSITSWSEPESWIGSRLPIRMARPATGPVVALTSSSTLPWPLMPAGLIQGFPRCFRGSFSTRFGGTAPNRVSTSATAIRSTIAAAARTCGVGCTAAVIGLFCTPRRKQLKNSRFEQHLTSTIGCV